MPVPVLEGPWRALGPGPEWPRVGPRTGSLPAASAPDPPAAWLPPAAVGERRQQQTQRGGGDGVGRAGGGEEREPFGLWCRVCVMCGGIKEHKCEVLQTDSKSD